MILKMTLDLPSDQAFVPVVRTLSASLMERLRVTDEDVAAASLIVTEVCTNVVRHAYDNPGCRYAVEVEYHVDQVVITVTDQGIGFSGDHQRPPQPDQLGGMGLWLVQNLADQLQFEPMPDGGTSVRAVIEVSYETPQAHARAVRLEEGNAGSSLSSRPGR